ncbi:C40 family peptidase [Amycolatopsis aidingensis]|uniref:C40 family peptidase n=1 Tax=Amycolatopsis aidingensis TaxID=2842453 RepID=UPI001E4848E6|nr:NlpC/P60 family protein [Amycolatopsis aidingensis]
MRAVSAVLGAALVTSMLVVPGAGAQPPPADPGDIRVEAGVAPGAGVPDPRPGAAFADPEVAKLQRAASEVQRELGGLAGQVRQAQQGVNAATARLQRARAERAAADAAVAAQRREVDRFARSVFTALGRPDELRVVLSAENPQDLLDGTAMINHLRTEQDRRLGAALERQRTAIAAEAEAAGAERAASARKTELEQHTADARNRSDAISAELRAPIDAANAAVIAQQRAQQRRNTETAANWKAYLDRLEAAGITPPPATALRDPARLPAGLDPVPGADGRPQAGLARKSVRGERVLVLPKETIVAVTAAVDALGKPYVPHEGGSGPQAYSCDGLVHSVFTGAGLELPGSARAQFATVRPVPSADAQPGDLVFLGPAKYGVQSGRGTRPADHAGRRCPAVQCGGDRPAHRGQRARLRPPRPRPDRAAARP